VRLKATERKVEMSSTAPDTEATHLAGNDDSAEKYVDGMSGDGEGFEAETPQARQAKAEALAHARAARAARAKYARLVSQQAGVPNRNPHNRMQAESFSDVVTAQGDRIGGTESSLAATKVLDQLRSSFPDIAGTNPVIKPVVEAGLPYLPLLLLRPAKRGSGLGAFVSDPRVWSGGLIAALAVAKQLKGRIAHVVNVKFTVATDELAVGSEHRFHAEAYDDRGKIVHGAPIVFSSTDEKFLKVDKEDGVVKAKAAGIASIKATTNGKFDVRRVTVK
jgi:uncharacterized protein YjdB